MSLGVRILPLLPRVWRTRSVLVLSRVVALALLVCCFCIPRAHAQTYAWTLCIDGGAQQAESSVQACAQYIADQYFGGLTATILSTTCNTPPTAALQTCTIGVQTSGAFSALLTGGMESGAAAPNACAGTSGKTYANYVGGGTVAANGAAMCGSDGCGYTASGAGSARMLAASDGNGHQLILQTAVGTGSLCTPSGSGASPSNAQPGAATDNGIANETCAAAGGNVACLSQNAAGKNCGTYNGDQVCVADVPPGTCVQYSSGGVACSMAAGATSAQSPPSPNNGTPGAPATPVETLTTPQGTVNYYNSAAVVGSSTATTSSGAGAKGPVSGAPAGTGTGTTGVGLGTTGTAGTGTGSSTGSGDLDCAYSNNCTPGDLPAYPDAPTVGDSTNTYMAAVKSAPIVAAFSNVEASLPGGTCPIQNISVFGKTIVMDSMCTLWGTVSGAISAIFLIGYVLMGIRILMSA